MFPDYHFHTEFSLDSDTPVREQIERAMALGMKELCVTDHYDYATGLPTGDFDLDFASYFSAMNALREEYKDRIKLYTGMELGLQVRIKEHLTGLVPKYPFDFIIGSSHFIHQKDPYYLDYFTGRSDKEIFEEYFETTLRRIKLLDCFDVLGHLDYIVRYGPNQNKNYSYEEFREYIDPILRTLIEKGKGIECNTGGYKYGLGQPNPAADVLTRYRELGGEILTIGSDAHDPGHLGFKFKHVEAVLAACGFRYYTVFHERKPEFLKI